MIQVGGIKDLIKILIRLKYFKINICSSSFTLSLYCFLVTSNFLEFLALRSLQGINQLSNCKTVIYWSVNICVDKERSRSANMFIS